LYYRVHRTFVRDGKPVPSVFRDRDGGMSTDWSRYSTPDETRNRGQTPLDNGVIALDVWSVREIPQRVEHEPLPDNRAHTEVFGEKDTEVRLKLLRIARWELPVVPGSQT